MKYTVVEIPVDRSYGTRQWCHESIGKSKGPSGELKWGEMIWWRLPNYRKNIVKFYFRNPEHATLFALRWL